MPDEAALERRAVELLQQLIRFRTVNPPGDEQAAQEHLKGLLEGAGFECELLAAVPGRPNLVARLRGRSDGPSLAYLGHIDTVLAEPAQWAVDPWAGELRDGTIWGRGALDMKSQVAAEIAAVLELRAGGWSPASGELLVIVTADEEAGAVHGAKWLCEEMADRVRCDLVVNEGGGASFEAAGRRLYQVGVGEKGVFRFALGVRGTAGHASMPRIADNALPKLAPLIEALATRRPELEPQPEAEAFFAALGVEEAHDLEAALERLAGIDPLMAVLVEPTLGVTFAPTMASASEKINVIPAYAEVRVDCRVPPGLGEEHARRRITEALGDDGYELRFTETVVGNRSPAEGPLWDAIAGFIAREDPDAAPVPSVLPGFTDSRWFREAFPECRAYGFFPMRAMDLFSSAPLIHSADERIPVEDLVYATRFFAGLAPEILG